MILARVADYLQYTQETKRARSDIISLNKMHNRYGFDIFSKARFYLSYLYYNLLIPFDCKKGRLSIIIIEMIRLLGSATKIAIPIPSKFLTTRFITKFGKFTVNPGLMDTQIISPAFERLDLELFLSLIKKELESQKKVLVLDIGAYFGLYSIAIGNAFKKYKNIAIYAFEPDSTFFMNGFSLLKTNIKENNIRNIKLFHTGLGSKDTDSPNKYGIATRKLDSLINKETIQHYDVIFMKIDIEGYEIDALKGARNFLKIAPQTTLLIEDCIDNKVIKYLEKNFEFYKKITPYNSFWVKSEQP